MTLAPERPLVEPEPPRRIAIACVKAPITKHPDNMHHDHLAALLRRRRDLRGNPVTVLAETLIEAVRWSV